MASMWTRKDAPGEWMLLEGATGELRLLVGPAVSEDTLRTVRLGLPGRTGVERSDQVDPAAVPKTPASTVVEPIGFGRPTNKALFDEAARTLRRAMTKRKAANEADWREDRGYL